MKAKIQNLINEYEKRIVVFKEIDQVLFKEIIYSYSTVIQDLKFVLLIEEKQNDRI